ncbi:TPA: DUF2073 domain-containing protein [Candidatus Woesearchaeota archaeon]|nr:DUF2073 domain-containing protein [Candidatus Woesearchaeota archaeon]
MLTLQFVPYDQIEGLSSGERVRKLLGMVKDDKIVVLEGRLKKEEEAGLIRKTMEEINDRFKGIELSVIYPEKKKTIGRTIRSNIADMLLGQRQGLTIIGPASLIKEIRKDPDKIQLLTHDKNRKKKRKR